MTHRWPFFDCLGSFFAIFMKISHKTEVQMDILRFLVSLNLNWIKSYYIILVKKKFFPCLKMRHFRAISPKWVLRPRKKISWHIFKMAILTKFFDDLMNHIVREYAGEKMNLFLNVSPLTIVNLILWPFKVSSLYLNDLTLPQMTIGSFRVNRCLIEPMCTFYLHDFLYLHT